VIVDKRRRKDMKYLNHPNFSLFCFMLNVWFALNGYLMGRWFMVMLCTACAALCMRNYIVLTNKEE